MKKFLITLVVVLFSTKLFAADLICEVKESLTRVSIVDIKTQEGAKIPFEKIDGYTFNVTNLGNSKFELDIFDSNTTSRSYSTGYLHTAKDSLTWTFWSRDTLIEANCKLK